MRVTLFAIALAVGGAVALTTASEILAQGMPWMHGRHGMMHGGAMIPPGAPGAASSATEGGVSGAPVAPADAVRGQRVYQTRCASCHGPDPSRDGPVGPSVKGAGRDLLMARVLFAAYPKGYAPKRRTWIMPAQPDLGPWMADLVAYLRAP